MEAHVCIYFRTETRIHMPFTPAILLKITPYTNIFKLKYTVENYHIHTYANLNRVTPILPTATTDWKQPQNSPALARLNKLWHSLE